MSIPDRIKDNVRAVLLSKTDGSGVLVSNFIRDYKSMLHEQLMYRDLGYSSLQDFIKALPEVCRLEFSEKDMAYRLYGISKPNTFVSSFVKRAEGSDSGESNKGRRGRDRGGGDRGEKLSLGTDLDEEWEPNMRGEYTICFPNKRGNGLETRGAVEEFFGKVGEIKDVNIIKQLTFVRYGTQTSAKAAIRQWGVSHALRRAEEKNKQGRRDRPRENDRDQSFNVLDPILKHEHSRSEPTSRSVTNNPESMQRSPVYQSEPVSRSGKSTFGETDSKPSINGTEDGQLTQVYVGNWPSEAGEDVLEELLEGYRYMSFRIIQGKGFSSKRYSFVDFKSMQEAQRLIDEMDGQRFMNRDLLVRLGKKDSSTVSQNKEEKNTSPRSEGTIEKEFERLCVHKGNEKKTNQLSPVSRTIPNNQAKKHSSASGSGSNSPMKMPPLESCMPDLECIMPDLEAIPSPKMPSLIANLNNNSIGNGVDDMPELQPMPLASPAQSYASSNHSIEPVQLFIGNFPYGTKEWELSKLLESYGGHSLLMMNRSTTSRSTYAFVSFDDLQQAQMAILNLDQCSFKGRALTVAMASPEQRGVMASPKVSYNAGPLARITCTVGGRNSNNERMVSVEDDAFSQDSAMSTVNNSYMAPNANRSSHMVSKRDDGFNFRKFTFLLKDYSQIVTKLRGDDDFQFHQGQSLKVLMTHADNEKFFWGQILADNVNGENHFLKQLQKIMSDLQRSERLKNLYSMGRCMAQYEGEWYRGWVTHVIERDGVQFGDVFYVDYGNSALIPLSQTFFTKPHIWTIPPLAKPFKLNEMMCQLKSLLNTVVVLDVIIPGTFHSNYLTTINLDY